MNHFSLASFRIFPLPIFVFQKFDYHVFRCGSLSTSYLECIEILGCLQSCISSNLGKFQVLFFQILSPLLLRLFQCIYYSACQYPIGLLSSVHSFCNLFSFSFSDSIIPIVPFSSSWTLFFFFLTSSNLSLNPSSRFFYFCCCNFQLLEYFQFFLYLLSIDISILFILHTVTILLVCS